MQLDRLTAEIRPRTSWEGLDLGFAFARNWFPALWGLWWLSALPVATAAAFWLPTRPDLWLLLVWWFKPLYEAPLLFWLSRALFDEPVSPRGLWHERRKILPAHLLPNLLWRRFQLSRAFHLPLILLEGLRGRERRQRKRIMQSKDATGAWLTLICLHLESILWASTLVLALFLVPEEIPGLDAGAALFEIESIAYWVSVVLYWLAMSIIAPFYVGAGFALYLTRRTELEAWDLELVFRRAGTEGNAPHRWERTTAGSVALLAIFLWAAPPAEADTEPLTPEQMSDLAAEVLAGEDFESKREIQSWIYVGDGMESEAEPSFPQWLQDLLEITARTADLIAPVAKWLLILLAAVVLALVAYRIVPELRRRTPGPVAAPASDMPPVRLPPSDAQALPADITGQVRALIAAGDPRAALALLYRASLSSLTRRSGLDIPESATEPECLVLAVNAGRVSEIDVLRRLTGAWQRSAYAHRSPGADELAALLRDWQGWQGEPDEIRK